MKRSSFLISAPASGSGKTTFTLGLIRALRNRGYSTAPFKCGPDYIDTKFHDTASGGRTVNLDLFFMNEEELKDTFRRYSQGADVAVAEGMMGLFDGYDKDKGSSAHIASVLDIPVIFVVNAKAAAYSITALLKGFADFDPRVKIKGVIFNKVSHPAHYEILKEAAAEAGVVPLGFIPPDEKLEVPSRHLGLNMDEQYRADAFCERAAVVVEKYIDVESLLALAEQPDSAFLNASAVEQRVFRNSPGIRNLRIAIAQDEAFNFTYKANIDRMAACADVVFFSPLHDSSLPAADLLYFPGGYPELHAGALSQNKGMLEALHHYYEQGGKIFAECGGFMYLCESITDTEGVVHPMAGIFPFRPTMEKARLSLGYRDIRIEREEGSCLFFRGHEFHHSSLGDTDAALLSRYELPQVLQSNAKGASLGSRLYRRKNVIAGYTHFYWGTSDACRCLLEWLQLSAPAESLSPPAGSSPPPPAERD